MKLSFTDQTARNRQPRTASASYIPRTHAWRWWLALTLLLGLFRFTAQPIFGQPVGEMSSASFIIQMGNFNMTGGTKSSSSYTLTDTVGETAPGEYSSTGYYVFAGFQYIYTIPRFTFRIIDTDIDLGEQVLDTFSTASHDLVVTTRASGFQLLARADGPLSRAPLAAATIPFTDCDTSCTISSAGVWTTPTNHGFGFNAQGSYVETDFTDATYFRPFADASAAENAQLIASHDSVVKDAVTTITYQLSVGVDQAAGNYATAIDYTAIPGY